MDNKELQLVKEFISANVVEADNSCVECVDGRYTFEQSKGAIRAYGGDFGMVMAVAGVLKKEGIQMDSDEIVSRYLKAVKKTRGEDAKLYYHTDSHHPIPEMGCGHVANAADPKNQEFYEPLNTEDIRNLYESFVVNERSEVTVLEGEHKEIGVLLVDGKNENTKPLFSVNSSDQSSMYFVVDVQRTGNFIKDFLPIFSKNLPKHVSSHTVIQSYINQMTATTRLLANGLPQYKIAINDDKTFSITPLARVK